jgi:hypothetical protein
MPRYEVVAHITCELQCESAEEAAGIVRRQLFPEAHGAERLVHLAVWREDPAPAVSPVAPVVRQKLVDFFATLEQCAGEAEEAFRGRVEAILLASSARHERPEPGATYPERSG